jgi:hypothetical protein
VSSLTRGRVCNLRCNHSMVRVAQNPQPYFTVSSETPTTWRARFPYLYPPGTGWHSYSPGRWVPYFISKPVSKHWRHRIVTYQQKTHRRLSRLTLQSYSRMFIEKFHGIVRSLARLEDAVGIQQGRIYNSFTSHIFPCLFRPILSTFPVSFLQYDLDNV